MRKFIFLIMLLFLFACKEEHKKLGYKKSISNSQDIVFVTNRNGNPEIYLMDINGENLRNLTNHDSIDYSPSWSSNGNEIFFYSNRDGNPEIYKIKPDGSNLERLTNHPSNDVLPNPSPDGRSIVFNSNRDTLNRNIYVMDSDGSNVKHLTLNSFYEESPDWSPDGREIIFTRQLRDPNDTSHAANGEIHIMNADGSNIRRLTFKDGYDSGAAFSSDGKKIAFYGSHNNLWDLYIMDSDGSNLYNLTQDSTECYSPNWSPNNDWLVYTAGSKGNYNIWKINIQTKERVQLTNTKGRNEGPAWKK